MQRTIRLISLKPERAALAPYFLECLLSQPLPELDQNLERGSILVRC